MGKLFKKNDFLYLGIICVVSIFFYSRILGGFFQQDEWYGFAWSVLHRGLDLFKSIEFFFAPTGGHYNPLTIATTQFLFTWWGMDYLKFAYLGIVLHVLVVISVYFLAKKIFDGNAFLGFLNALLFGIFASPYQGVSWVIADISTLSATLIGVMSAILFLRFLDERKNYQLMWSLALLIVSLLFKEVAIGLFPLYFIIYWFYVKQKKLKVIGLFKIGAVTLIYLFIRVFLFFLPHAAGMGQEVGIGSVGVLKTFYNLITIPIKSISQGVFPLNFLELTSRNIARLFPTRISGQPMSTDFDKFALERVMEVASLLSGALIAFVVFIFGLKTKQVNEKILIFFGLGWTILGSFIFSISPGTNGIIYAIDSRNLYFTSIGISILIIYFCNLVAKKNQVATTLILLPIFIFNIYFLNLSLENFVQVSNIRRDIVAQIADQYPKLPSNTVFYTESSDSYYGLPENIRIMPFQSGFGQTLLAFYENRNNFPHQFFEESFLWSIDSQGYKEVNGKGFGYYRNFYDLVNFFEENRSNKPTLIAYSFNARTNELKDITTQVEGRIDGFESRKKLINPSSFTITSSLNNKDVAKTLDENLKTVWNSGLPYSNYQYIILDMKKNFNIAEITINSYNDKNQNGVGYLVEVSLDGKSWKTVFESNKYPPDSDGVDNLYFEPTSSRFVKIEQIGYHKYSSWVVNELGVYEKN